MHQLITKLLAAAWRSELTLQRADKSLPAQTGADKTSGSGS